MSTDTDDSTTDGGAAGEDGDSTTGEDDHRARVADLEAEVTDLREEVADLEAEVSALEGQFDDGRGKLTIIATQGTFDMAYPPLILASTAAAFGWEVVVFHTFWALDVLHEEKSRELKLSAVGNPNLPVPNALAALPGMDRMATKLMERKVAENGTATIEELIATSLEQGVDLQACQMTMDLMDYDEDDFYDEVTAGVGAATALDHMADSDVQLLV